MNEDQVNLIDYIYPQMDILFLALNAPENSNNNAHWFSNNLSFWNLLYNSGLITERIDDKLQGDEKVFGDSKINYKNWIYGVTDLDKETVETDSTKIKTTSAQVERIKTILDTHQVGKLCIMHSKVASAFIDNKLIKDRYGKVGMYNNTEIFNVPFHNASIADKENYYSLLLDNNENPSAQITNSANKPEQAEKEEIITKQEENIAFGVRFTFPDIGNSITESDVKGNKLRITVSFKKYFPTVSQKIKLVLEKKEYICSYSVRPGKSNTINLGKELNQLIRLRAGSLISFQKINSEKFIIKKLR